MSSRSYLRDSHGPRAVDVGPGRDKVKSSSRRHRDADDAGKNRSKREGSHRSSKKDSTHRRKPSDPLTTETLLGRPTFELAVIHQPPRGIALGMPVETSVMISLVLPSPDMTVSADSVDTSRLFAVASLVADSRSGERIPLEAGILTGQKMFDSVHSMPRESAARLSNNQPCRLVLGYFSFPDLLVRQSGTYRLRTTLVKTGDTPDSGASSILAVDSEAIKVERPATSSRRRQHGYHS